MGETDLDLRGIISVLHRQSHLIFAAVIVVLGLAVIFVFAQTPTYTSSALVLVDTSNKNLLDPQPLLTSASADSARIDSEVELARSDSVLLRVIEQENLISDDEFGVLPDTMTRVLAFLRLREPVLTTDDDALNETLSNLRSALSVQRRGLTYLLSVQVRSEDPDKAARLANATASAYIGEQLDAKIDSVLTARSALDKLQQNTELARNQYQTVLARSQDLEARAQLQVADSRIVSPALAPQRPSSPNKTLIFTIAALLAAGIGIALAFLRENLIGGFTSQEQVEAVLGTPVAAVIPRERPKSDRDRLSDLMVQSPLSFFAESIRRARASIEQALRGQRHGSARTGAAVIMVTSTAPKEGKTTFALSLARSHALSGERVLLIDCDLRNPGIHRHLGWEPKQGLMEILTAGPDSGEIVGVVARDGLANVTVITGTRRSEIPTDQLLAGATFGRLIHAARQSFDTIILDTPPLGPVVDGLYIAPFADVICFLTRSSHTSQRDAKKCINSLAAAKQGDATILAVLNQQHEAGLSYQRRYESYYSYSS